jgi:membrane protein
VASTIQTAIRNASISGGGILTTGLAVAGLVFSATTTFAQLQHSLNAIWGVKPDDAGVESFAKKRFTSFLVIVGIAILVLISLCAATVVGAITNSAGIPFPDWALYAIEVIISAVVFTACFAIIFKVLPDAEIAWKDVWAGAAVTSILFVIGKFLISLYLGHSSMGSVYGGAGALALLLLWTYYSSCILFFGAEFTEVWGKAHGRSIKPEKGAVCLDTLESHGRARQSGTPTRHGRMPTTRTA